jgi:NAD(P)-dependent dehydrogenase (short-subunit alcohol dehydrogenase family)
MTRRTSTICGGSRPFVGSSRMTRSGRPSRAWASEAYARAKLLTVMAGYEAARRLQPHGVTVNSMHPGIVATDIIDDLVPPLLTPFKRLIRRTMLTPEQGASTALRLATDPQLTTTTGAYFVRDTEASTPPLTHDPAARRQLWDLSADHFNLDR